MKTSTGSCQSLRWKDRRRLPEKGRLSWELESEVLPALWGWGCLFTRAKALWPEQTSCTRATERRVICGEGGMGLDWRTGPKPSDRAKHWGVWSGQWCPRADGEMFRNSGSSLKPCWQLGISHGGSIFYHRSQQMLQIRATAFSRELFVKLQWPPALLLGIVLKPQGTGWLERDSVFLPLELCWGGGVGRSLDLLGLPIMSSFPWKEKPPLSQSWPFIPGWALAVLLNIPIEELVSPLCDFLPRLEYQTRSTRLAVSQACKI